MSMVDQPEFPQSGYIGRFRRLETTMFHHPEITYVLAKQIMHDRHVEAAAWRLAREARDDRHRRVGDPSNTALVRSVPAASRVSSVGEVLRSAGVLLDAVPVPVLEARGRTTLDNLLAELLGALALAGIDTHVPHPASGSEVVVKLRALGRIAERTAGDEIPLSPDAARRLTATLDRLERLTLSGKPSPTVPSLARQRSRDAEFDPRTSAA